MSNEQRPNRRFGPCLKTERVDSPLFRVNEACIETRITLLQRLVGRRIAKDNQRERSNSIRNAKNAGDVLLTLFKHTNNSYQTNVNACRGLASRQTSSKG